jgi:hypothetical protein
MSSPGHAAATPRRRPAKAIEALGDTDLRVALRPHLLAEHASEPDTVVIEELGLCRGQVRVDIAVVNGLLHGVEIKSDRDSLRRLAAQADIYSRIFDRATLVVGRSHLVDALEIIPAWWRVLRSVAGQDGPRFKVVRRGRKNPSRDPRYLVELLWLDEAIEFLEQRDAARGVRGKPRHVVWDRICDSFEVEEIATAVRAKLKLRAARQADGQPS